MLSAPLSSANPSTDSQLPSLVAMVTEHIDANDVSKATERPDPIRPKFLKERLLFRLDRTLPIVAAFEALRNIILNSNAPMVPEKEN